MAREKSWMDRIPEIREKLGVLPEDFAVDRDWVASLFGVSGRTALRILQDMGAQPDESGRLTLAGHALLKTLASPEMDAVVAERQARQQATQDLLAIKRRFGQPPQDPAFPLVEAAHGRWQLDKLPAAIQIEPGRLTVEFADLPDLLWQLEVLVATLSEDREKAQTRLEARQQEVA